MGGLAAIPSVGFMALRLMEYWARKEASLLKVRSWKGKGEEEDRR